jgi:hypothetical protein
MPTLRIEHAVPDFDGWKREFDEGPVGRERSGVRRYRIFRSVGDPNHVVVDLDFDSAREAEILLAALHEVWARPQAAVVGHPRARLVEAVESGEF